MDRIKMIYPDVDNLTGFRHPVYGPAEFMKPEKLLDLCEMLSNAMIGSGCKKVLVSECGARPLAYICENYLRNIDSDIGFTYVKFPRESSNGLFPLLIHYLNDYEKAEFLPKFGKTREAVLRETVDSFADPVIKKPKQQLSDILLGLEKNDPDEKQKKISRILKDTVISKIIGSDFIFFDEYIDSGTTLQNAKDYFGFFSDQVNFRTLSYFMNINISREYKGVLSTLFDKNSYKDYYNAGVYPFENRIDLIGYFYCITDSKYEKVHLEDIMARYKNEFSSSTDQLIGRIDKAIDDYDLLEKYKDNFVVPVVKDYLSKDHLVRQYLLELERETVNDHVAVEFLWQLADMYGPIWSPMPKENHLDFFAGTDKSSVLIRSMPIFEELKGVYLNLRLAILHRAAESCLERKNNWLDGINSLMEERKYGYKH